MMPILEIGPWHIRTYGLLLGLALFVVGLYGFHRLRRLKLAPATIVRAGLPVLVGGFLGAWLASYLPAWIEAGGAGLAAPSGGLTIGWGVATAVVLGLASCALFHIPLGRAFDLGVLACPLGQAIGRLGCLAAGCCAGRVTSSWLGVYLPGEGGVWARRYPAPLLDAAAHFLIFLTLVAVERALHRRQTMAAAGSPSNGVAPYAWPFDGFLFVLYLALSSLARFGMAFVREGASPVLGPFSAMHLQGMAGLALAALLIVWSLWRSPARRRFPRQVYG